MNGGHLAALALCFCLTSGSAFSANPKVQQLAKDAQKLYDQNKYKEAAETLEKAYQLEPSPVLLYNSARAWDQAGELQKALDSYRTYVGLEGTDPKLVEKANRAMDRLRTLVAKDAADQKLRESERQRLEAEAQAAKTRADQEAEKGRKQKAEFDEKESARQAQAAKGVSTRWILTAATTGAAVVALGFGIGFGLAANGSRSAFNTAASVVDKRRLEQETRGRALVADISFGIALAAAIATVVVFPKNFGHDEPAKTVQVSFAPGPSGGHVVLGGRF